MKQIFTLFLIALTMNAAFAQNKTHNDDFQIPHGDFETWYHVVISPSVEYDEIGTGPTDNWMGTLNSLAAVPPTAGGPGPITVYKTSDVHSGNFAAKAVSATFPLGFVNIFIPGMVGTAVMDMANVRAVLGKPCADCRPSRFKGYYKYEPVGGDSCAAMILLTKWNSTAKKRDTIGIGGMVQRDPVSSYTLFDIPVNYFSSEVVDTMTLLVVSSAGFNLVNFMGSAGQDGSTIYLDDLTLDYASGIQQVLMPEVAATVYPNPASGFINIELSKDVKGGVIEVFDAGMKLAGTFPVSGRINRIGVSGFATGSYYFRLLSGSNLLNSGTFVVNR
jgi:hypothetical protein